MVESVYTIQINNSTGTYKADYTSARHEILIKIFLT